MPKTRSHPSYATRSRWTVADARAALEALAASGLAPSEFAMREQLDIQRIYRWRRRLSASAATALPAFVELRPRGAEPIEVVLRSGRVLRVSEAVDAAALGRLVEVLDPQSPC